MANVVHRTTKQYLKSVDTENYPSGTWIVNPDMNNVSGVADKYWTITGDVITEMNQAGKDTVDAAELAATQTDCKADVDNKYDNAIRHANSINRDTAKTDIDNATTPASCITIAQTFMKDD